MPLMAPLGVRSGAPMRRSLRGAAADRVPARGVARAGDAEAGLVATAAAHELEAGDAAGLTHGFSAIVWVRAGRSAGFEMT